MDIIRQAHRFHYICTKLAQEAETAKPLYNQDLVDLAFDTMEWKGAPGVSVDTAAVQAAGKQMYTGVVQKNSKDVFDGLNKLQELTRDGGGDLFTRVQQAQAIAKKEYPETAVAKPAVLKAAISSKYYQLLGQLEKLAQSIGTSNDPDNLGKVRDEYTSLKPQIEDAGEYLQFTEATGLSGQANPNDPSGQTAARAKVAEVAKFRHRLAAAQKIIDDKLQGFAGTEREVAGPSV